MRDCSDTEIRELLPELVHERLDAPTRTRVLAHLEACDACRAEVMLLRELRAALTPTVRVDVAAIVAALPAPSAGRGGSRGGSWLRDWRVAAAIAFIAAGAGSFALLDRPHVAAAPDSSALVASAEPVAGASTAIVPSAGTPDETPVVAGDATGEAGEDLAARTDRELQSLLSDLDTLEALQAPEPDLVSSLIEPPYGS